MARTSRSPLKFVHGTPAKIAEEFDFDSVIQPLRTAAFSNSLDFTDIDRSQATEEAIQQRRRRVAHFVGKTTRATWERSNSNPDKAPGQKRWKDHVVLALNEADQPVAYWRTALNVSSGFERSRIKQDRTGFATTIGGMVERGIKRVFTRSHTVVWTPEYGATPGYEHAIPVAGALALSAYNKKRAGTMYLVTEDRLAKQVQLPTYGYSRDTEVSSTEVNGLFGPDTKTSMECWTVPTIRMAQQKMLESAGLDALPLVDPVSTPWS